MATPKTKWTRGRRVHSLARNTLLHPIRVGCRIAAVGHHICQSLKRVGDMPVAAFTGHVYQQKTGHAMSGSVMALAIANAYMGEQQSGTFLPRRSEDKCQVPSKLHILDCPAHFCRLKCGRHPRFQCQAECRALRLSPLGLLKLPGNVTCKDCICFCPTCFTLHEVCI